MPSVVKHSYLKGKQMQSKASAHINYVLYRREERRESGSEDRLRANRLEEQELDQEEQVQKEVERNAVADAKAQQERADVEPDKKQGARRMYSHNNDYYSGTQLKKDIGELKRNDVVHKLIISPGRNDVDTKNYVREVMTELGRAKGQDLRYGFVIHENTDHKHAHVILLGRDQEGGQVRIDKLDHMRIRAFGDRYLEREHNIERVLDRDMEEFCRTRNLNPHFEKERGEEFYDRLYKSDKANRDHLEWEKFNTDWQRFIVDKEGTENRPHLGRSQYHDLGRISDFTALSYNDLQKEIWTDIGKNHPEMKDLADEKLAQLEQDRTELQTDINLKTKANDPYKVLDNIADQINREQKEFQDLMKNGMEPEKGSERADESPEIQIGERSYSKYDSLEDLLKADEFLREDYSSRIPKDQYSQLWQWIGTKEKYGNDCFGERPQDKEKELEPAQTDKSPEQSKDDQMLDALRETPADGKELKQLDDFVGFSDNKQLNLDREQDLALTEPDKPKDRASDSLDEFLGFGRKDGPEQEQELATDRGLLFETPRDAEADRDDRDDSDDLFEMGFN